MFKSRIKTVVGYAREIARKSRKKAKPLARKILSESIKLERMMEEEAKKALSRKAGKKKRK